MSTLLTLIEQEKINKTTCHNFKEFSLGTRINQGEQALEILESAGDVVVASKKILEFKQTFDFVSAQLEYQLTDNENGILTNSIWQANRIIISDGISITGEDGKEVYDSNIPLFRTLVIGSVDSLGKVTLNVVPNKKFEIRYNYQFLITEYIDDYKWEDVVRKPEYIIDLDSTNINGIPSPSNFTPSEINSEGTGKVSAQLKGIDNKLGNVLDITIDNLDDLDDGVAFKRMTNTERAKLLLVNQDVTSGSSPVLDGLNITGIIAGDADQLHIWTCKSTPGTIPKGRPVYLIGYHVVDNCFQIEEADSSDSGKMPAIGITESIITDSAEGWTAISGRSNNLDTDSWNEGDELWVDEGGGLVDTKPQGINLIQKIAQVMRKDVSIGALVIFGAGRSNDVPNIPENKIWKGDSNGVPQQINYNLDTINEGSINKYFTTGEKSKLNGIEDSADVNNISNTNATDLTDNGESSLHYHSSDRNRVNHTGSQTISTITDLQTLLNLKLDKVSIKEYLHGLNIGINSLNPLNQIDIQIGICDEDINGNYIEVISPITVDITAVGVNGLDEGTEANNTWYYIWIIKNLTGPVISGLISASPISPTMPSGYTIKRRIGVVRNNVSGNFIPFRQRGHDSRKAYMIIDERVNLQPLSGGSATSWTTIDISSFQPPIAESAMVYMSTAVQGAEIRPFGTTIDTYVFTKSGTTNILEFFTGFDQKIDYKNGAGGGNTSMTIIGYCDNV